MHKIRWHACVESHSTSSLPSRTIPSGIYVTIADEGYIGKQKLLSQQCVHISIHHLYGIPDQFYKIVSICSYGRNKIRKKWRSKTLEKVNQIGLIDQCKIREFLGLGLNN
jgi:hypothetical protein